METAEQRNDTASKRMANGAVIVCTRTPVRPGPATSATDSVKTSLLFPSRRFSRSTSDGR
jgi:hypothetical protein